MSKVNLIKAARETLKKILSKIGENTPASKRQRRWEMNRPACILIVNM